MIRWTLSRYLRCDDGHPSPSPHRKWINYRLKSTHSLQSKTLVMSASPKGSADGDRGDDVTEERSGG